MDVTAGTQNILARYQLVEDCFSKECDDGLRNVPTYGIAMIVDGGEARVLHHVLEQRDKVEAFIQILNDSCVAPCHFEFVVYDLLCSL